MFIFHWGHWFAVKQVTFAELDSLCCNFPSLEWLSGVCFGHHKQLYESKQFKSKDKLNRPFVHCYALHYLKISCCRISGCVTRKLPLCMLCWMQFLYCREWRHINRGRSIRNLLLLLSLLSSVFSYIVQNFPRAWSKVQRTFHFLTQTQICVFNFWPDFLFENIFVCVFLMLVSCIFPYDKLKLPNGI